MQAAATPGVPSRLLRHTSPAVSISISFRPMERHILMMTQSLNKDEFRYLTVPFDNVESNDDGLKQFRKVWQVAGQDTGFSLPPRTVAPITSAAVITATFLNMYCSSRERANGMNSKTMPGRSTMGEKVPLKKYFRGYPRTGTVPGRNSARKWVAPKGLNIQYNLQPQ